MKKYLKDSIDNTGYDKHNIKIPGHMLLCARTGAGKTNALFNYISMCASGKGTFSKIHVVYQKSEPIYDLLRDIIKDDIVFYDSLTKLPDLNELDTEGTQLVIFDDQVNVKDQSKINEYMLRARKHGNGVQCIYIAQSFFKIPIFIRQQASYLLILGIASDKDLNNIISVFNCGISREVLKKIFKNAIKEKLCMFKIALDTSDLNQKFSRNWLDYYTVVDDELEVIDIKDIQIFKKSGLHN